jgi:hypothetical protein
MSAGRRVRGGTREAPGWLRLRGRIKSMSYSVKTGPFPEPPENLRRSIESLRPRWRWIVALGVLTAGMGVRRTCSCCFGDHRLRLYDRGFYDRRRRRRDRHRSECQDMARVRGLDFAGLTYIVDAAFALAQPFVAAAFFTLVLDAGMIATGVARCYLGARFGASPRHPAPFCSRGCSRRWLGY